MTTKNHKKTKPSKKVSVKDWHPADIIAALHKSGWTLVALASEHGLTTSTTLSRALTFVSPINEKRIADAIGIHPKTIWPSRYNEDGSRKLSGYRGIQSTRRAGGVNGKDQAENHHEAA
ncbi:helix-turn-helix domain-containing protein [Methylomonas koyamae]|uniref:helix-turn-helix domain-containing protein n=1 Tax=Methylomonas koyamae TaxID=702114 RepID=UPI0009EDE858|nr:helix-turn-helix transcriptional regulator [Methylomonas koyamae]ATG89101.1 Nlp family transcriptional regulator [Methylomonas koyamae]